VSSHKSLQPRSRMFVEAEISQRLGRILGNLTGSQSPGRNPASPPNTGGHRRVLSGTKKVSSAPPASVRWESEDRGLDRLQEWR